MEMKQKQSFFLSFSEIAACQSRFISFIL